MCLECSGQHRGLGVHVSFVRSVTMDAWKDDELARMQAGGNEACHLFLEQYDVPRSAPIPQKYHSPAAAIYREGSRGVGVGVGVGS